MTVKRAVGAVLSRGASWIQGRDGGGDVEIARLSSMKSRSFLQKWEKICQLGSVCGSGMFIPDPGSDFFHPGSRFRIFSIPNPGSASKRLSILTQKNGFHALGNMIWVVHSGSGTLVGVCGFSSICQNRACMYPTISSWIQIQTMRYFVYVFNNRFMET
jgi:hypothetical protein